MHMAIAILRTEKGLDYSDVLATGVTKSKEVPVKSREKQLDGSDDDTVELREKMLGSQESLEHNESHGRIYYLLFFFFIIHIQQLYYRYN